jgi:very-short-patch-repair endonuclease
MKTRTLHRKRPATLRQARALRSPLTPQERALWSRLRARRAEFKFRRQHPAGAYILDFLCREASLAIEIDSDIHAEPARANRDRERTAWLLSQGVEVVRVTAADVERSPKEVVEALVEACKSRVSSSAERTRNREG